MFLQGVSTRRTLRRITSRRCNRVQCLSRSLHITVSLYKYGLVHFHFTNNHELRILFLYTYVVMVSIIEVKALQIQITTRYWRTFSHNLIKRPVYLIWRSEHLSLVQIGHNTRSWYWYSCSWYRCRFRYSILQWSNNSARYCGIQSV